MRIKYNSPVILTYALIAIGVLALNNTLVPGLIKHFFVVYPGTRFTDPVSCFRLVSHVIGHGGWDHLLGNFTLILLIGPLLEEKYGSKKLFEMVFATALVTGLLNTFLFSSGLLGASGIAFMLILLGSFSNIRAGEIPLTFIIVAILFLGGEVINGMARDNISQFAHLIGGGVGALYGFFRI